MVLLIDASNIQTGGGLTHLIEILRNVDANNYGFKKIMVCSSSQVLDKLEPRPWLEKYTHNYLNRNYFHRALWTNFILPELLKYNNAFLFLIGSIRPNFNWPYVTICQNLLPLEWRELSRFGFSRTTARLILLRRLHLKAYANAMGVIFLTRYSHDVLPQKIKNHIKSFMVIPHGINHDVFNTSENKESKSEVFRILYISIINVYKHQDKVAQAVIELHKKGHSVQLNLVGPAYKSSLTKLNKVIKAAGAGDYITYKDYLPYEKLAEVYKENDGFIFASSCETFGMILTEAMAMGMPIACSNRSSLPETMGDVPIYFDPENTESIEDAISVMLTNKGLRQELSAKSLARAKEFNWEKTAALTFGYIGKLALERSISSIIYHDKESQKFQAKYIYRKSFRRRLELWEDLIASHSQIHKSMDVGCGPGLMTQLLSKVSTSVIAIDGSFEMIERSKIFLHECPNISFNHVQITPKLFNQYPKDSFNLIIMSSVLEYLEDAEDILLALRDLLATNGELIFSVPNERSWFRKVEYFLNKWFGIPPYRSLIINSWNEKQVKSIVNKLGFKVKEVIFQGDVPIFSQLFFWLPSRLRKVMMVLVVIK